MNSWQPIETAPKNEWVLIRGGRFCQEPVERFRESSDPATIQPCVVAMGMVEYPNLEPGDCCYGDLRWVCWFYESAWRGSYADPTQWYPLPAE